MSQYEEELEAALEGVRLAGQAALGHWRGGLSAEVKEDASPVTVADRECERILVEQVCGQFPDDGIVGEEGAAKFAGSGRRWIIDPIDGTRDFVRGSRLWAMLIALEDSGEVKAGIAHFPALGETYWARRGAGAYRRSGEGAAERIRVSGVTEISHAVVCVNGLQNVHLSSFGVNLLEWIRPFWAVRSLGGALDAMLVASGGAEAWIEQSAKAWDLAAIKIIVEEAGGRFFNFDGGSSIYGGNCVACVPALETALRRLVW